ncbi:MAG: glutathione S-transferase family protein [Reyranella sp.]|uniref:glutathione S-transferase family protein n=1 Tax=Reyranella sp. TaxID=1929291 RepID=UPI00120EB579|nr:glutathione S-transferase N-terminal domain-containing protein [Reyranella sp.]TAJ39567.1 MAG: glutathione S-transferase family protein [Reyranella sp.]
MQLIGRYDSPFVRRVGISLHLLGLPFEQLPLSVFSEATEVRKIGPLGRVPVLVLADGEVLIDSVAILDYLDGIVGPARRLIPPAGAARRQIQRAVVTATGAADKAIAISYERRRPPQAQSSDWIDRCRGQIEAALKELETGWPSTARLTQAEITTAVVLAYVRRVEPAMIATGTYPWLERMVADCERHPAFLACPLPAL